MWILRTIALLAAEIWLASCTEMPSPIDVPFHIANGSATVSFSVTAGGEYFIEIRYPKAASDDVGKELHAFAGTAIVTSQGKIIERVEMPTHWLSYYDDSVTTILLRFRARARAAYQVLLQITYLPPNLATAEPTLTIRMVGPKGM
jgi:hypothetical protein